MMEFMYMRNLINLTFCSRQSRLRSPMVNIVLSCTCDLSENKIITDKIITDKIIKNLINLMSLDLTMNDKITDDGIRDLTNLTLVRSFHLR